MHFSNPVTTMKMCEVIYTPQTEQENVDAVAKLAEAGGKVVSMVKDTPGTYGFLLNRIFGAAYREARQIADEGIATKEDIDKAMITGPQLAVGLLRGARRHRQGVVGPDARLSQLRKVSCEAARRG